MFSYKRVLFNRARVLLEGASLEALGSLAIDLCQKLRSNAFCNIQFSKILVRTSNSCRSFCYNAAIWAYTYFIRVGAGPVDFIFLRCLLLQMS